MFSCANNLALQTDLCYWEIVEILNLLVTYFLSTQHYNFLKPLSVPPLRVGAELFLPSLFRFFQKNAKISLCFGLFIVVQE